MTLLRIENLRLSFMAREEPVEILRGVQLEIAPGELLGLVGESGSGKSLTGLALLGLAGANARVTTDVFSWNGRDIDSQSAQEWRDLRGSEIGMVFQNPSTCLDPHYRIGTQLEEILRVRGGLAKVVAQRRSKELLAEVGLQDVVRISRSFPHQLSGGMNQRVMIALAIALDPKLLIADEATTALDVTTQEKILSLFRSLANDRGMAVLFISHDLGVVRHLCDRVSVMYAGAIVEGGPVRAVLGAPKHPYSEALLGARPQLNSTCGSLDNIAGQPPLAGATIAGCAFAPRCSHVLEECTSKKPSFHPQGATGVSCLLNQGAGLK